MVWTYFSLYYTVHRNLNVLVHLFIVGGEAREKYVIKLFRAVVPPQMATRSFSRITPFGAVQCNDGEQEAEIKPLSGYNGGNAPL